MNFLLLSLFALLGYSSCTKYLGESECLTGIFDEIKGDLTLDRVKGMVLDGNGKLVYGMIAKPSSEIIKYTIENGLCDVNNFDGYGRCSLFYALDENDFEAAKLLISLGANANKFTFNTILVMIARAGNIEGVRFLLNHGVNVDCTGKSNVSALVAAVESGNLEIVKLIAERADPAALNHPCRLKKNVLAVALNLREQNEEIINFLISKGARVEND